MIYRLFKYQIVKRRVVLYVLNYYEGLLDHYGVEAPKTVGICPEFRAQIAVELGYNTECNESEVVDYHLRMTKEFRRYSIKKERKKHYPFWWPCKRISPRVLALRRYYRDLNRNLFYVLLTKLF